MTFLVRHGMRQSNLKLAKHEGTDLSWRNIAIWEVIKHEIMEISIWTCSFQRTIFALWGYKASCQRWWHLSVQNAKKLWCLFVFLPHQLGSHRGMSNTTRAAENQHSCLFFFSQTFLCAITLESDKPDLFCFNASVGLDIVFHHVPMGGYGISMDQEVIHSLTLSRPGRSQL